MKSINLREHKRAMCFECKKITHQTLGIKEKHVPYTETYVEVLTYFCNICQHSSSVPHDGLIFFQEAIQEHKKNAPSIQEILEKLPEKRRYRWVDHFNEHEGVFVVCDCSEEHKGADCDDDFAKYYYTKSDWHDYIKNNPKPKK